MNKNIILLFCAFILFLITKKRKIYGHAEVISSELCLGKQWDQTTRFQKTSFSNISKISASYNHSLFQNDKGEIFACGANKWGQCGLGHFNHPQITPSLIPNVPSNIVQFVCGNYHSLFLDSEGNVFCVGDNFFGQLGLAHKTNQNDTSQNVLNKISNIPPIKIISCGFSSSYLIDFGGNLWSFGNNEYGQLGLGHNTFMTLNHFQFPKK